MEFSANGIVIKLNSGESNLLYNELELVRRSSDPDMAFWGDNRSVMKAIFDALDKAGIDGSR